MAPEKHRQRCQLIPIDPEVGSKPWDHNFFGSIFCMTNVLNKMTENHGTCPAIGGIKPLKLEVDYCFSHRSWMCIPLSKWLVLTLLYICIYIYGISQLFPTYKWSLYCFYIGQQQQLVAFYDYNTSRYWVPLQSVHIALIRTRKQMVHVHLSVGISEVWPLVSF